MMRRLRLRRGGKMDVGILRIVVVALSAICVVCLSGIIVLAGLGKEPPVALASICSICAGALVGILVPSGHPLYLEAIEEHDKDPAHKGGVK